MRFLESLLAAGLSTIAVAIASALPSRDVSSVYYKYTSESPSENTDIPTLSQSQFTLALAHRLGLSQFHSLTSQDDVDAITKVDGLVPGTDLLGGNGKGKLVIHISTVQREMFSDLKPTFNVASKNAPIDQSIFEQAEDIMGAELRPEWILDINNDATERIEVFSNSYHFSDDYTPWDGSDEGLSSLVNSKVLSKLDHHNPHHQIFVTGFTSLKSILQDEVKTAVNRGEYVFIHIPILNWLEANSEAYAAGVDLLSAYFHHLLTTHDHQTISDLTLIVSPASQPPYTQHPVISSELKKRKEIPISIISSPAPPRPAPQALTSAPNHANPPVFTSKTRIPATFKDKATCEAQTNQCSAHGLCVMSNYPIKDSWSCKCNATTKTTKSGTIKTFWAGNACQKQDISVQFHLILIFTILMVGGIAAVIAAMISMGAQELPGVLTAGMPAKRQ